MSLSEVLIPAKKSHSITETALTIFLINPIVSPRRFQSLMGENGALNNIFQRFQIQKRQAVRAEFSPLQESANVQMGESEDTGFMMESYVNGNVDWVVKYQTANPYHMLSVHSLDYPGWNDFKAKCLDILKAISEYENNLYFHMITLTYKDDFTWKVNTPNWNDIFKSQNAYLPSKLLNSRADWSYKCSHQVSSNDKTFLEHIDSICQSLNQDNYYLSVSHNIASPLGASPILLDEEGLSTILSESERLHAYNKDFLKEIFVHEVTKMIGVE